MMRRDRVELDRAIDVAEGVVRRERGAEAGAAVVGDGQRQDDVRALSRQEVGQARLAGRDHVVPVEHRRRQDVDDRERGEPRVPVARGPELDEQAREAGDVADDGLACGQAMHGVDGRRLPAGGRGEREVEAGQAREVAGDRVAVRVVLRRQVVLRLVEDRAGESALEVARQGVGITGRRGVVEIGEGEVTGDEPGDRPLT
ncbi:hypothetical protein [Nannocystis pusilla]|uniref:hypothetical protein n=1 Tax=Nannocystis pusilla TaxID=889268 RepID=UPI003B826B51